MHQDRPTASFLVACFALAFSLSGCLKEGIDPAPVTLQILTESLGPDGGLVTGTVGTSFVGAQITAQAGAFAVDTGVTISAVGDDGSLPSGMVAAGRPLRVSFASAPSTPVTVRLRVFEEHAIRAAGQIEVWADLGEGWTALPVEARSGGTVSVAIAGDALLVPAVGIADANPAAVTCLADGSCTEVPVSWKDITGTHPPDFDRIATGEGSVFWVKQESGEGLESLFAVRYTITTGDLTVSRALPVQPGDAVRDRGLMVTDLGQAWIGYNVAASPFAFLGDPVRFTAPPGTFNSRVARDASGPTVWLTESDAGLGVNILLLARFDRGAWSFDSPSAGSWIAGSNAAYTSSSLVGAMLRGAPSAELNFAYSTTEAGLAMSDASDGVVALVDAGLELSFVAADAAPVVATGLGRVVDVAARVDSDIVYAALLDTPAVARVTAAGEKLLYPLDGGVRARRLIQDVTGGLFVITEDRRVLELLSSEPL